MSVRFNKLAFLLTSHKSGFLEELTLTEFLLCSYKKPNPTPVEHLKNFGYEKSKRLGVLKGNKYAFLLYFCQENLKEGADIFYKIGILNSGRVVALLPFLRQFGDMTSFQMLDIFFFVYRKYCV